MAHEVLAWFLNSAFVHTLAGLATAFVLATLIGAERQWRQRTAGLRTNVLVAVGAAAFADLGTRLLGRRHTNYLLHRVGYRLPWRRRHPEGGHPDPRPEHRRYPVVFRPRRR